jgi:hypothetical protein
MNLTLPTFRDIVFFVYFVGFFLLLYQISIADGMQCIRDYNALAARCAFRNLTLFNNTVNQTWIFNNTTAH